MRNPDHPTVAKMADHVRAAAALVDELPANTEHHRLAVQVALADALRTVTCAELSEDAQ